MSMHRTCDCMACEKCADRERSRRVYRAKSYGTWDPKGDLDAVVAHLGMLREHRVGLKRISDLTGLSTSTLHRVRSGRNTWVTKAVADAIMSVRPEVTLRMSPVGVSRRIQALLALGWSTYYIGDRLGIMQARVWELSAERVWVKPETHEAISRLYDELSMTQGPSTITRRRAATAGYVPPLAWDDIDDVFEQPTGWRYQPPNRTEVLTDLDECHAGLSDVLAALDITKDALEKWCERNGMRDVFVRLRGREDKGKEAAA